MPLVVYAAAIKRAKATILAADTRAVSAEAYECIEAESGDTGGILRGDILDPDIRPLGSFVDGDEVYVEGDDPDDVLDDTDDTTIRDTHIWWRAVGDVPPNVEIEQRSSASSRSIRGHVHGAIELGVVSA
jgi:hypothetical protein